MNPPPGDLASTVVNNTPSGVRVTAAMLPVVVPPPSGDGSGGAVLSADPRFDGIVVCSGPICVIAPPAPRP
jgi:hypothetical protein